MGFQETGEDSHPSMIPKLDPPSHRINIVTMKMIKIIIQLGVEKDTPHLGRTTVTWSTMTNTFHLPPAPLEAKAIRNGFVAISFTRENV